MDPVSRRNALRLVGGAGAGALGATALEHSLLASSHAAPALLKPGARALKGRRTGIRRTLATGVPHFGMSAPVAHWDNRLREVGSGVGARRIFADLADGPRTQMALVRDAHRAGQLPVISYKVGGDIEGAINGKFDRVASHAADRLASFGKHTAVTFWHEPHGDMSPEEYVVASRRILAHFRRPRLKLGPILNGWLLDSQESVFASYTSEDLFEMWDWFGFDTYESGTMENPGEIKPARRIRAARAFLRARDIGLPLGIGEYNGYSAKSIARVGTVMLTTRDVWFGCVWNSTGGKGYALEGDRLAAYRETLATAKEERAAAERRMRRKRRKRS